MTTRPQDTSAEEPDGGNPHIRFRGGPRLGDRPGLLNSHPNHQVARKFFAALFAGDIRDELLAPGMTAWTTLGPVEKANYQGGVKTLVSLFIDGFNYTIDSLTAEEDRVAAEIRSKGTFADGDTYENVYVFLLRIRDGRIASVAEHFNPDPVVKKVLPRLQAAMAKASG